MPPSTADDHEAGPAGRVLVDDDDGLTPGPAQPGDAGLAGVADGSSPGADAPPGPPVHRLRDLDRRGRIIAAVCAVLMLVPVGASVARAVANDWVPSNDDALIVLQAFDVFSSDPPLVGQPSTSQRYIEGVDARHPGPIEFYLLAVPVQVLGPALGTLLTVALLAGGSVLVTAWVMFRRGGPVVALGATLALALAMWASGTAVLSDPVSSNVGGYPLLAGTALAWALWCDDRRLWPLAAAVWSFTIQQHLAVFGIGGLLAAWGVAGAVVMTIRHRHEVGRLVSSARWAAASVVIAVVAWLPPLIDQVAGTGNLGRILHFGGQGRERLGPEFGLRAIGRTLAVPPMLLSRRFTEPETAGWNLIDPLVGLDALGIAAGVVVVLGAVTLTVLDLRRGSSPDAPARVALAATLGVVLVGGLITVTNIPFSLESARINFYRWAWPATLGAWGLVAWTVGARLTARRATLGPSGERSSRSGATWPAAALLAVAAVVVGATSVGDGAGDVRRDEDLFAFEREAIDALVETLPAGRPVRLDQLGPASVLSIAPALAVGLEDAGFEVRVDDQHEAGFGEHRVVDPQPGESIVVVRSAGDAIDPDTPGELVARSALADTPGSADQVWGDTIFEVRVVLATDP